MTRVRARLLPDGTLRALRGGRQVRLRGRLDAERVDGTTEAEIARHGTADDLEARKSVERNAMTKAAIARLKITLNDVEPQVLRRIEVPLAIRLDDLHVVLQAALGWTDSHLWELRGRDVGWGIPDPDYRDGPLDARKARLGAILEDLGTKTLRYLYDFGDGWEHTIKIERIALPVPGTLYPRLLDAKGQCPPEDIGGPWGYADFLAAHNDPGHELYAHYAEWMEPGTFDPVAVDFAALDREIQALAEDMTGKPKPAAKRKARK